MIKPIKIIIFVSITFSSLTFGSVLDWSNNNWIAGSLTQDYIVDSKQIKITVEDDSGALSTVPTAFPISGPFYQGGETNIEDTLIISTELSTLTTTNEIKFVINAGTSGIGLDDVSFKIFDVDGETGTFLRREQFTISGSLAGNIVLPSIAGTSNHTVSSNVVEGINPSPVTGSNSGIGTVSISFTNAVDMIEIIFKVVNSPVINPNSNPGFSISDINFNSVVPVSVPFLSFWMMAFLFISIIFFTIYLAKFNKYRI